MNEPERKRRGPITLFCESRRFRWGVIAVVLLLPVLYVASFGPACWWFTPGSYSATPKVPAFYMPIGWLYFHAPHRGWIARALDRYATLLRFDDDWEVLVPIERDNWIAVGAMPQ